MKNSYVFSILLISLCVFVTNNTSAQITKLSKTEIKFVSKNYSFPVGLSKALVNSKTTNINAIVDGIKTQGENFRVNCFGEQFRVITIRNKDIKCLGTCDSKNKIIIVNQYRIDKLYDIAKNFLTLSSLEKDICSREDFCEAILFHELFHYFNPKIEIAKAEFFAEFAPQEQKAKKMYLVARFYEHITGYNIKSKYDYHIVKDAYDYAFEIDHQIDTPSIIDIFKSLILKYGFDGLSQRYKSYQTKIQ